MKKLLLLSVTLIFFININLSQISNLTVFSEGGELFKLSLNNELVNQTGIANVKKSGITEGRYIVKVDFEDLYTTDITQTIVIAAGYDLTYIIKKNKKGEYQLRGFNMTELNNGGTNNNNGGTNNNNNGTNNNSNSNNGLTIDYDGGVYDGTTNYNDGMVIEFNDGSNVTGNNANVDGTNISVNYSFLGSNMGMDFNINDFINDPNYTDNGYQTKNAPTGCYGAMNNYNFSQAKQAIANETFESDKEGVAMQIIGANCLYSMQVKDVLDQFDYESTKLKVAKFAYHHTLDIGNYFLVNSAFEYDSTKEELRQYINSLR